jgi:hypothetical protein
MPVVELATRLQLVAGTNVPVELEVKLTLPVEVDVAPTSMSVTVAVQVELLLMASWLGLQLIAVDVARLLT